MRVSVRKKGSSSGKVINVPAAYEELVDEAKKELGINDVPCILLTEKGDVIDSISVLRDGDIVYLRADGQNVNPASTTTSTAEMTVAEISTIFAPYTHGPFNPSPSARRRVPSGRRPSATITTSTSSSSRHVKQVSKRVMVLRNMPLPVTRRVDNIILDGQIVFEKNETDVQHHIIELLKQKFPSILESANISLLRCNGKLLTRPILPATFTWSGAAIAKFVGQGSLYVQLMSEVDSGHEDSEDDLPAMNFGTRRTQPPRTAEPVLSTAVTTHISRPTAHRPATPSSTAEPLLSTAVTTSVSMPTAHRPATPPRTAEPVLSTAVTTAVSRPTADRPATPPRTAEPVLSTAVTTSVSRPTADRPATPPSTKTGTIDLTNGHCDQPQQHRTRPNLSLTRRRQQTADRLAPYPTISMNFDYLDHPSMIMGLYDDTELEEVTDSEHRNSDIVVFNHGPTVQELLRSVDMHIQQDVGNLRILVRRGHVLEDAIQRLRRCGVENLRKPLVVTFIGEEALDEGGPTREMFSLFLQELASSQYMCHSTLSHNGELRSKKLYRVIGWALVLSLLHGGPAPRLFSPGVVRYILQQSPQTGLDDMGALRDNMVQLMSMTREEIQSNIDQLFDARFEMGYTKPTSLISNSDIEDMTEIISYHICVELCRSELDQLLEGLGLFGFIDMARANPGRVASLFEIGSVRLTADGLRQILNVTFSEQGTNTRTTEEAVYVNLSNLWEDVEAKEVTTTISGLNGEEDVNYSVQLEDILFFFTGCGEVPPLGYPPEKDPQLVFDHIRTDSLLRANTCACILFVPMTTMNLTYDGLRENMISSVCGSPGFGQR